MPALILDLETTDLLQPTKADIAIQPYITELCALKINERYEIIDEMNTFIKPPIPIPPRITKLTGINDSTVERAPAFPEIFKQLANFFFGANTLIAHNLSFDLIVLVQELKRIKKQYAFPYPPVQFCTVEQSMHIKGYRLKNDELYKIATGKEMTEKHRARTDALATLESYKFLRGQKK